MNYNFETKLKNRLKWLENKVDNMEQKNKYDYTNMVATLSLDTFSKKYFDIKDFKNEKSENLCLIQQYKNLMERIHIKLEEDNHFGIHMNEGCCDVCIRFFHRYRMERLDLCYCTECETV